MVKGRHLLLGLCLSRAALAGPAVAVDLYTIGPSVVPFNAFGHAELCVHAVGSPGGTCYSYGTADFSQGLTLAWNFVRARSDFWVDAETWRAMNRGYRREDRAIWLQRLPLPPDQAWALAQRLAADLVPSPLHYRYDFFADNCATRLRDQIDVATEGALRVGTDRPYGGTIRDLVRRGFQGDVPLQALSEVALGRVVDRAPTVWEAMFLPDVLRATVTERFGVTPELVYSPMSPPPSGRRDAGQRALIFAAIALSLLATRAPRPGRAPQAALGLALGLPALLLALVALISALPDFRVNEVLLVLLPTDLALRWLEGARLRAYLAARLVGLALVGLALAGGLLIQPLGAPMALAGAPLAVALARTWRSAKPAGLPAVR